MDGNPRNFLIKRLYSKLPRGAPFGLSTLNRLEISAKQAAQYVQNEWLVRIGQGVYAFPGDKLYRYKSVKFLQQRVRGMHIAAKSALALFGIRHYMGSKEQLILWGDTKFELPEWFASRFPSRYSSSRLFLWPSVGLSSKTLRTPPGAAEDLLASVPERAILELLSEVGTHESLEDTRNLFENLRPPRLEVLGSLLSCCNSVKTVRLFLQWARATGIVNTRELEQKYQLPTGSKSRWMKRLKDGTLLTLKPHG